MPSQSSNSDSTPTLVWLVGFRWAAGIACVGLLAVAVAIDAGAEIIAATAGGAALIAITNQILTRASGPTDRLVGCVLILDVAVLTTMLGLTGGAANPFAVLLIVHIALAGLASRGIWSWTVVVAAVVGYGTLFFLAPDSHLWHRTINFSNAGEPVQLHLLGMWVATAIAAISITALTRHVLSVLERHRSYVRDSERRLERTTHLASLTTLAAGATHELGSPLTTVAVLARELERQAEQQGITALREDASTIRDEVDRCREILGRMSAGVGIQLEGSTTDSGAVSLRESVNGRLEARADRVIWEGQLQDLPVAAIAQLTQLVLPLIGNALDACEDQAIQVSLAEQSGELSVEVKDGGEGMSEEVLSRSVEPFFTTKPPGHGMGLGLHLVRVVSDALGGRLTLASTPGLGTSAQLVLPRASLAKQHGATS